MAIEFDFSQLKATEFGVRIDEDGVYAVPVNAAVQDALLSMAYATIKQMQKFRNGGTPYSPAEKHAQTEYLIVRAGDSLETAFRNLHESDDLTLDVGVLRAPDSILYYFARFTDSTDRQLTAVRRAAYFKGVMKSPLLGIFNDSLNIVNDSVFKLDNDFDLFVDSFGTHILRPSSFELLGELKRKILGAVKDNVSAIATKLPFVDLGAIESYARSRLRAARYLASIRMQELVGLEQQTLAERCRSLGVATREEDGRLVVCRGSEMRFLELLDRRLYELELIPNAPETYRAASRDRIGR